MFSNSKVTAVCTVAMIVMVMMMMMTMEAAAMPKPDGQTKHSAKTHKKSDGVAVETVPLQLDPSSLIPPRNIRPLENASISPWTYNVSHNDSLFPHVLSEARCLLQGCLNSEGLEDQSLESRPIMHQVLLLRRVKSEGAVDSYHFRLESRLIAVGCTCVRPIVQHQQ